MSLTIKICGMRKPENILEIGKLEPDLIGFIFYPESPRYAAGILDPEILSRLPRNIRKAGIFVNADFEKITGNVRKYSLDIVQLHGNESPDLCHRLKEINIPVIKTFNIKESAGFKLCNEFIEDTDYFLFDASTKDYGGSGYKFDWKILGKYDLPHPFFLSGGIGPKDVSNILKITNPAFYGIDLNSRFEIKPGLKDPVTLKKFITDIRSNTNSL